MANNRHEDKRSTEQDRAQTTVTAPTHQIEEIPDHSPVQHARSTDSAVRVRQAREQSGRDLDRGYER